MAEQTLDRLIETGELKEHSRALSLLCNLAEALDSWPGISHVSPAEIKISDDGRIAMDGPAEPLALSQTSLPPPSRAAYLSPEEILGSEIGPAAKQFSLAVIAYELLAGCRPFTGADLSALIYQICAAEPAPIASAAANLVLARALSKKPEARFPSCVEFVNALGSALHSQPTEPLPVAFDLPPARHRRDVDHLDETSARTRRELRSEPEDRPRFFGLGNLSAGKITVLGIIAAVLFFLMLNRDSGPATPHQTIDTHMGPLTPAPGPEEDDSTDTQTQPPAPQHTRQAAPITKKPAQKAAPQPKVAKSAPSSKQLKPVTDRFPDLTGSGDRDVELLTEPPGAGITVDSHKSCVSPCTLTLSAGRHVLSATLPGYATAQRIFNTPQDASVFMSMRPSEGVLIVSTNPSGAVIWVDGHESGNSPLRLRLRAGQHRITAFLNNQSREQTVNIQGDSIQGASLNLQ